MGLFRMRKLLKSLFVASAFFMAGAVVASAADVKLTIQNSSAKTIYIDAIAACTGCTTSSATSIASSSSGTSTATANSGVTSMTYSTDYSNYFGTNFTEKGCRATITLTLSGGIITGILGSSWTAYTGNPSCTTTSSPQISADGTRVTWGVRFNAS